MSETDTETTLCADCAMPIEAPKKLHFGPFVFFQPDQMCKDCVAKVMIDNFNRQHRFVCPYKTPHWRPRP